MPDFAVSEGKIKQLRLKMTSLGVREEDILETFARSSGPGGQHVNKTSTSVHLIHIPSGISVTESRERSQSLNRFLARRKLLEKLEEKSGTITAEMKKNEKLRRQKERRRRRRVKKSS